MSRVREKCGNRATEESGWPLVCGRGQGHAGVCIGFNEHRWPVGFTFVSLSYSPNTATDERAAGGPVG